MNEDRAKPGSPWLEGEGPAPRAPIAGEHQVDVAVVGAGIVGLTAALLLQRAGARVAVLEARQVAAAASGNNTAKLSSLQGLAYSSISRGAEAAARFARSNEDGLALIASLVEELAIDCGWRRVANYTFAEESGQIPAIESEFEQSRAAGLNTEFVDRHRCRSRSPARCGSPSRRSSTPSRTCGR